MKLDGATGTTYLCGLVTRADKLNSGVLLTGLAKLVMHGPRQNLGEMGGQNLAELQGIQESRRCN